MSELNDDLLNYELGDDDVGDLTGVDEDALLLSDEDELNLLQPKPQKTHNNAKSIVKELDISTTSHSQSEETPRKTIKRAQDEPKVKKESPIPDVSTTEKPKRTRPTLKRNVIKSQQEAPQEEVSSTYKETDATVALKPAVEETAVVDSSGVKESEPTDSQELKNSEQLDPNVIEENEDAEDEREERFNPKFSTERESHSQHEPTNDNFNRRQWPNHKHLRGGGNMGGGSNRGGYFGNLPRPQSRFPSPSFGYPYCQSRPEFNKFPQQNMPPFQGMRPNKPMPDRFHHPNDPRMNFRNGNFRGPFMNDIGPIRGPMGGPIHRPQLQSGEFNPMRMPHRPEFHSNTPGPMPFRPFNSNVQGPPVRFENNPRMPVNNLPSFPANNPNNTNFGPPRPPIMLPPASNTNISASGPSAMPSGMPPVPRKVLINPNFKGGVEAATNQLMKDTYNSQFGMPCTGPRASQDDELLRQQEAFINQNRMHIEKRRHERSPERERSYSPPRRDHRPNSRERRIRGRGGGRGGRGGRRENFMNRRRDSESPRQDDKKEDVVQDEDEETKAYRQKIEKQKALREKLWRDKEMRRRKAAEEKEAMPVKDATQTDAKLKPIIVTESKIISLKKKTPSDSGLSEKRLALSPKKTIGVDSGPKSLRITKQVNQRSETGLVDDEIHTDDDLNLDDEYPDDFNENEESTTPPPPQKAKIQFSNRRVVLKSSQSGTGGSDVESALRTKRIFDRLDHKKIGVNEAAKRKIQRIVINNSD